MVELAARIYSNCYVPVSVCSPTHVRLQTGHPMGLVTMHPTVHPLLRRRSTVLHSSDRESPVLSSPSWLVPVVSSVPVVSPVVSSSSSLSSSSSSEIIPLHCTITAYNMVVCIMVENSCLETWYWCVSVGAFFLVCFFKFLLDAKTQVNINFYGDNRRPCSVEAMSNMIFMAIYSKTLVSFLFC